jgi:hypothetical protein
MGQDAVQDDKMHPFVVEAVVLGAEFGFPIFPQIEIVVMLPHHISDLPAKLGHDLQAVVDLFLGSELGEIGNGSPGFFDPLPRSERDCASFSPLRRPCKF